MTAKTIKLYYFTIINLIKRSNGSVNVPILEMPKIPTFNEAVFISLLGYLLKCVGAFTWINSEY